jgi:hypothetical protein
MNEQVQTIDYGYAATSADQRNRVLRNTYWLLALSLLPTVLGAWIGVATGVTRGLTGGIGLVVFLAGAFGYDLLLQFDPIELRLARRVALAGHSLVEGVHCGLQGIELLLGALVVQARRQQLETVAGIGEPLLGNGVLHHLLAGLCILARLCGRPLPLSPTHKEIALIICCDGHGIITLSPVGACGRSKRVTTLSGSTPDCLAIRV